MRFKVWSFGLLAVSILATPASSLDFSRDYRAGHPYCCQHTHLNHTSSPAFCGAGYGLVPGCCEYTPSWADRIWDGYCQKQAGLLGWGRCHKPCGHRAIGACRSGCGSSTAVCGKRF
jgi:hypothetical protein